jgi:Flp pilus assembly protein TadD
MSDRTVVLPAAALRPLARGWSRTRIATLASWAVPLAIAALTFALFAESLRNGFVEWDDHVNVLQNTNYRGLGWVQLRWMFSTTLMGHYIPLTWMTLGLDYTLWGMDPLGYHLTNVLLHTVNATLFYFLALRLLRAATKLDDAPVRVGAAMAALFFAAHPLRVESVAWVTERRDVLSGALFLATLLLYLRSVDTAGRGRRRLLVLAAISFGLALVAKSIVMTTPLVLVLLDIYPLRRIRGGVRDWFTPEMRGVWLEKVPFVVLAAAGAAVSYYAVSSQAFLTPFERYPWPARVAMVCYSLAFYLWKTVLPLALSPMYELPAQLNPFEARFVGSALAVLVITALTIAVRRRWAAALAVWASYVIVLAPVTGILHAGYQLAHDRYSYLSCLGWALLVGAGAGAIVHLSRRRVIRPLIAGTMGIALTAWLLGFAFLTYHQIGVWRDSETLWAFSIDADPSCALCRGNLGTYLVNNDMPEEGIRHLQRGLELRPDGPKLLGGMGLGLYKLGRVHESLEYFREGLALEPYDQSMLTNMGVALIRSGDPAQAVAVLERALSGDDDNVKARTNLGTAFARLGDRARAIEEYREVIRRDPTLDLPRAGLARLYFEAGDLAAVKREYDALRSLGSRFSHDFSPAFIEEW